MELNYCVFNKTTESFLGLNVRCADTPWSRLKGLLGTFRMSSDEGVWVVPSRGIHTIGMLIPVDVVYLDASCRVIHLVEHLGPFRVGPIRWKSSSVLELPPHAIYASHTKVGDQLIVCLPQEMETYLKNANQAGVPTAGKEIAAG
jgi:uncharacterized membrane protein (UPF0127 family)